MARLRRQGLADPLEAYSICAQAAKDERFTCGRWPMAIRRTPDRLCIPLRCVAVCAVSPRMPKRPASCGAARRRRRAPGRPTGSSRPSTGIGRADRADLFVDCSRGSDRCCWARRSAPASDWSHWLLTIARSRYRPSNGPPTPVYPVDRARRGLAVADPAAAPLSGNGYVFSSAHLSGGRGDRDLAHGLDGEPRPIPGRWFRTGGAMRSGSELRPGSACQGRFLEPLRSTSIHLIRPGSRGLLEMLPTTRFRGGRHHRYNRLMTAGCGNIRDFIISISMRPSVPTRPIGITSGRWRVLNARRAHPDLPGDRTRVPRVRRPVQQDELAGGDGRAGAACRGSIRSRQALSVDDAQAGCADRRGDRGGGARMPPHAGIYRASLRRRDRRGRKAIMSDK